MNTYIHAVIKLLNRGHAHYGGEGRGREGGQKNLIGRSYMSGEAFLVEGMGKGEVSSSFEML